MSIYSRCLALILTISFFIFGCTQTPKKTAVNLNPELKNYISLDLAYPYYKMLLEKLERRIGHPLKSRGEAHITIITPPEYKVLTTKIPAEKLHAQANEFMQQSPAFTTKCLGHFEKKQPANSTTDHVYYVVTESKALLDFRKRLAEESGLPKTEFDPDLFYPHVTLGFTDRDFHYEDGAIKNEKSCPPELKSILRER
jgi:2'-5' RNA ligase